MADDAPILPKLRVYRSKIGALPIEVRDQLNQRLLDGQLAPQVLPWLHSLPEVLRILDERFREEPISAQNLSEWRKSGYADWLARREKTAQIRSLSDYALKLAQASGGTLEAGAAAIAGGRILELLEASTADDAPDGIDLAGLIESLTALRKEANKAQVVEINRSKLGLAERELALSEERFRRLTCEHFLDWFEDEKARRVVEGSGSRKAKLEQLVQMMFGDRPDEPKGGT